MSADLKIKSIRNKYAGRIRIALQKTARQLAQNIVDLIKLRTRVEGEGTNGKLKPLSKGYVKSRNRYRDNLSPETSPGESNLTATGQMIDALRGRAGAGKVTVDIKPTKRKSELSGGKSKLDNNQVRAFVEKDREFLKLSDDEKREVIELARQIIEDELRDLSK